MNDKAIPHFARSRTIRPTPRKPNRARKDALRRSHKPLSAALRKFRAFPWGPTRTAVELATEAVQRADLLAQGPAISAMDNSARWEEAWLAAHLALHQSA
jgi:hypothetical protein